MTPEAKVKLWLDRQLKLKYPDGWFYKAPGGAFGRAGIPDYLCCINGLFVAIEVKSDKGSLTTRQVYEIGKIKVASGIVVTIFGKDENSLLELFSIIDSRIVV